jgi:hypothetical protein
MPRSDPRAAGVLLLGLSLLAGCTSLSDSMFILSKLEDPVKSNALTEQGIARYQLVLVSRGEYSRVAEVRRYFEVALRYDPDNPKAKAYLEKIDNYRNSEGRKRVREAQALLKRGKRSQEEDYAMCLAVQRAYQLLPEEAEVASLHRETTQVRGSLVEALLQRSKASKDQLREDTPIPAREKLTIESFRLIGRALAIDPANTSARSEERAMRSELSRVFESHRKAAEQNIEKAQFAEAGKELALLEELNRSLGHPFDREVESLGYGLNYRWARALFERKEYAAAEARADAALKVRRTDETASLKRRIAQARAQSEAGASFESGLQQADRLIAQGELAAAQRRIDLLARDTSEPGRLASLEERRERIRAQLPSLYQQAVNAYKAEEFEDSIRLFQVVVQIDVEYEQAADYLDKATAKQKLLDQYGGDQ